MLSDYHKMQILSIVILIFPFFFHAISIASSEEIPIYEPLPLPETSPPAPSTLPADTPKNKEDEIGIEITRSLEAQFGLFSDDELLNKISELSSKIIKVSERPNLKYTFKILDTDMVNAIAVPGGHIYLTKGLINFTNDDNELMGVIAHEIVHIARQHGLVSYKKSVRAMLYNLILLIITQNPYVATAANMITTAKMETFGREAEIEADKLGVKYLIGAGFNPSAFLRFLDKLENYESHRPNFLEDYFEAHLPTEERIKFMENYFRELNLDPQKNREYKISEKLKAKERCKQNKCVGIIVSNENEIMRLGSEDNFNTPYERAQAVTQTLNEIFKSGIKSYEFYIRWNDNLPTLWAKGRKLTTVTLKDTEVNISTLQDLAILWKKNLEKFLWYDYIKSEI